MQGFLITALSFMHIAFMTVIFERILESESNKPETILIDLIIIIGRIYLTSKEINFGFSIMIVASFTLTYSLEENLEKEPNRWISWIYFIKLFDVWRAFQDIKRVIIVNKSNPKMRLLNLTLNWIKYLLLSRTFFKIYKIIYQKLLKPYEDLRMFTFFVALSLLFCIEKEYKKQTWLKRSHEQVKI